ncbi:30S ribosomal protein S1 [Chlorella vulgaris]
MSGALLRRVLGSAASALGRGTRGEASMAAATSKLNALASLTSHEDPIMQPYYKKLAKMDVFPAASVKQASRSETDAELALLRLHNSSLPTSIMEGHMIKAEILEVGRRTVTLDTGLGPARVSRSDLPPDCLVGTTVETSLPRGPGELREGDVVQVFLESVGTLEGDFLVSGVQAATVRRMAAVWNDLEQRLEQGELVKGRILNSVYRGYAVGVAGTVAFLPARQCSRPTSRRLGQLQKFRILEVERASARIVLADPNLHYNSAGSQVFRPGSAVKRPPRNLEESQRRLELAKVAEELRSVLALRSSAASSSGGSSPAAARTSRPQQQAAEPPQRKKG